MGHTTQLFGGFFEEKGAAKTGDRLFARLYG
jgi:hypothetical protein